LDEQFLHMQLDTFRAMEPPDYFSMHQKQHWPARLEALCRAINGAALDFARYGQNVVIDHVLSRQAWTYALEDFIGQEVILVKVACSLEDAELRETRRPERKAGLARSQWDVIHAGRFYDLEVNTSDLSASQAAQRLNTWLRTDSRPTAFLRMLNGTSTG
jgi:chloramphenicol 3-O phosphotransferase